MHFSIVRLHRFVLIVYEALAYLCYCDVNDAIRNHPVELIGQELRGYMTDMKRIAVAG